MGQRRFDILVAQRWEHEFAPFAPEPYERSQSLPRDIDGRPKMPPPFAVHTWRMRRLPIFTTDTNPELTAKRFQLPIRFFLKVVPPVWLTPVITFVCSVIASVALVPALKRWYGIGS